ncbi:DNA mismatch repair protein mutS [Cesiribacter andamanensis AMV16]|uniref:DNA mismatch repair protein mutS n=1 Tax=Cesiribacter andamanensis AMV16 TaxID=1279009 RepID=M7N9E8_9BACT|nr:DNA mismatch repair protein mutS [Cesiribacter andamanensis AMV16]
MSHTKTKPKEETPLMKQYNAIKAKHPGALLLFRVGDFYETFGEDAVTASKVLDIVLTKRSNGSASEVELAGFPHHSLDSYRPAWCGPATGWPSATSWKTPKWSKA